MSQPFQVGSDENVIETAIRVRRRAVGPGSVVPVLELLELPVTRHQRGNEYVETARLRRAVS
jgi:hypothetical protein